MRDSLVEPPTDEYPDLELAPLWVPSTLRRSTFRLIWSCALTLLLCTWTILHPHVPAYRVRNAKWSRTRIFFSRCWSMCMGLWFPDLLVIEAVADYFYAWKLCEKLKDLKPEYLATANGEGGASPQDDIGYKTVVVVEGVRLSTDDQARQFLLNLNPRVTLAWPPKFWKYLVPPELERSFYVGIGGFEINMDPQALQQRSTQNPQHESSEQYPHESSEQKPPQSSRWWPFGKKKTAQSSGRLPLTRSAFFILSALGLAPKITIQEINDKSKTDPIGKALACLQAVWMLVQVLARRVNGLPITILEFNTVINSACALMAYLLWLSKPQGVNVPTKVPVPDTKMDSESEWRVLLWVEDIREWAAPSDSWSQDYPQRRVWPWEHQPNGCVGSKKAPAILRCHVDNRTLPDGSTNPIRWTIHETDWDKGRLIWETQNTHDPLTVCVRTFRVHSYAGQPEASGTSADGHDCEASSLPRRLLDKGAHVTCFRFSTGPTDHQGHLWIDRQQAELLLNLSLGKSTQVGETRIDWKRYQKLIQELGTLRPDSPKKLLQGIWFALWPHKSELGLAHIAWQGEDLFRWTCMPLFGVTYGGVHLGLWSSYFPTRLERYLWRFLGIFMPSISACLVLGMALTGLGMYAAPRIAKLVRKMNFLFDSEKFSCSESPIGEFLLKGAAYIIFWILVAILLGISWAVIITSGVVWRLGRVYFFVEGIASLRSLPVAAYQEVDWTQYWPHF